MNIFRKGQMARLVGANDLSYETMKAYGLEPNGQYEIIDVYTPYLTIATRGFTYHSATLYARRFVPALNQGRML